MDAEDDVTQLNFSFYVLHKHAAHATQKTICYWRSMRKGIKNKVN